MYNSSHPPALTLRRDFALGCHLTVGYLTLTQFIAVRIRAPQPIRTFIELTWRISAILLNRFPLAYVLSGKVWELPVFPAALVTEKNGLIQQ